MHHVASSSLEMAIVNTEDIGLSLATHYIKLSILGRRYALS